MSSELEAYCFFKNLDWVRLPLQSYLMTQGLRGNDLLAICCIRRTFIEGSVDVETIVLETPLIYDDVCREKGRFDVFRVPITSSVIMSFQISTEIRSIKGAYQT